MFDFLELNNNEHKETIYLNEVNKDIPENQKLILSDLITIEPSKEVLTIISEKILIKYSIVPLFILPPTGKPILPKHLNNEFWGNIEGRKGNITFYIAMENPFDQQILNILRSITGYSIISIPIVLEDATAYLNEKLKNIKKIVEKKENKSKNYFDFVKPNIIYIVIFFIVILLLFQLKYFIELKV